MLVYSIEITPRLNYIADFLAKELTAEPLSITTDRSAFIKAPGAKINYSNESIQEGGIWICPHAILFQTGIQRQEIKCFHLDGEKAFFKTDGGYPFDIFAATFYLLSRYEEYLPHRKDSYGRFSHEDSLAFREDFLHRPLVNLWIASFRKRLREIFPSAAIIESRFEFLPTYDIDIAWSYKEKGLVKLIGAGLRSATKGQWKNLKERWQVMRGQQRDPYDSYDWLYQLHKSFQLKPYYFFLVADRRGKYDKNISPSRPAFRALVRDHFKRYPVGVHPSWNSGDDFGLLKEEIGTLQQIIGQPVLASRQHYIRFTLGESYRRLLQCGILYDFSMGYGSINGFRASVASRFLWYDLENEKATDLNIFPFCYMDANSFYEQQYSTPQALDEMRYYWNIVKKVNGTLVTIWHNQFLGSDPMFAGWKEIYKTFIEEVAGKSAPVEV